MVSPFFLGLNLIYAQTSSYQLNKWQQNSNCFCLTHVWLFFEKGFDNMKHFNYILYKKINTVILIETSLRKHNQEHFQFLFQMLDFAARQGFDWVSQRVQFWVKVFPCHRRVEWDFLLILSFQSCQTLLAKRGYQSVVWRQHLPPTEDFSRNVQYYQVWYLIATGIHMLCCSARENFLLHFQCSLLVAGNRNSR